MVGVVGREIGRITNADGVNAIGQIRDFVAGRQGKRMIGADIVAEALKTY